MYKRQNLYRVVKNNPINKLDPSGLLAIPSIPGPYWIVKNADIDTIAAMYGYLELAIKDAIVRWNNLQPSYKICMEYDRNKLSGLARECFDWYCDKVRKEATKVLFEIYQLQEFGLALARRAKELEKQAPAGAIAARIALIRASQIVIANIINGQLPVPKKAP